MAAESITTYNREYWIMKPKKADRAKVKELADEFEKIARRRGVELVRGAASRFLKLSGERLRIEREKAALTRQLAALERKSRG